jgi:hypothetical protein
MIDKLAIAGILLDRRPGNRLTASCTLMRILAEFIYEFPLGESSELKLQIDSGK